MLSNTRVFVLKSTTQLPQTGQQGMERNLQASMPKPETTTFCFLLSKCQETKCVALTSSEKLAKHQSEGAHQLSTC